MAVDGGRLKLEWRLLESGQRVESLLFWNDDRLIGFCGLYTFAPEAIELVGMVAPEHRRGRIGTSLLQTALRRCRARGCETPLLVVPRSSPGGKPLALHHAGTLDHSERVPRSKLG